MIMRINNIGLKKIYRKYVEQIPVSDRKKCPSSIKIMNFFRGKLSERQKTKIIDHITNCPCCLEEFDFILKTLRFKLRKELEDLNSSEEAEDLSSLRLKIYDILCELKNRQKPSLFKLSFNYVSIGVILALLVGSILLFFRTGAKNIDEKTQLRGEKKQMIELVGPLPAKIHSDSLLFKWKKVKGCKYYILELYDEKLNLIWKSGKISRNRLKLPHEVKNGLKDNKKYFWSVAAYSSTQKLSESLLKDFFLILDSVKTNR